MGALRPVHILILVLVVVILFGWKKLPDAARSLGRSMRIFKSEVEEMKNDGKTPPSAASSDTVRGETVRGETVDPNTQPTQDAAADRTAHPIPDPVPYRAPDPATRETHNQPPV